MRSFATVAAAAAVLSTASAFDPQAQRSPLGVAISAPVTSNIVLNQAAEEDDPLDFTPEVCAYVRAMLSFHAFMLAFVPSRAFIRRLIIL